MTANGSGMKETAVLTTTSLLSILLMTFHLADDIILGMSPAGLENLVGVAILAVWLFGTLVGAERRVGSIIMLLGSVFGLVVPVIHMQGRGGVIGGGIDTSGRAFFFVWTLLAMGVTSTLSLVLSARALWRLPWRRQR